MILMVLLVARFTFDGRYTEREEAIDRGKSLICIFSRYFREKSTAAFARECKIDRIKRNRPVVSLQRLAKLWPKHEMS